MGVLAPGNLSLSAILFLSNTVISLFVAIIVIAFFGWENYGSLVTILTFSFILNQIATGGSQNEIVKVNANLLVTNLNDLYKTAVRHKRFFSLLITTLILTTLIFDSLGIEGLKNFDTTMLVIMLLSSLISPNLRIRLSLFISNERYKSYFLYTFVRNLVFLAVVLISTLFKSMTLVYASFVIADAFVAFSLALMLRHITVNTESDSVVFNARSSFQFTCLNLYHELIPKIDLFCLFFLVDSSFIGKYSILVLLSEGMHALYGVIRTQNTPKFSALGVSKTKLLFIDLKKYLFTSLAILSMGITAILILQFLKLFTIDEGPDLLILLSLNSILLLLPIIYASVLTQWGMHTQQLKLSLMHLILSISFFVIGYQATGLTLALGFLSLANSAFAITVYYFLKKANPHRDL